MEKEVQIISSDTHDRSVAVLSNVGALPVIGQAGYNRLIANAVSRVRFEVALHVYAEVLKLDVRVQPGRIHAQG